MEEIRIVPSGEEHVAGFNAAVGVVARERRWLTLVDGVPIEASREFVRSVLANGGVHLVAVAEDGAVVGWCDIDRGAHEGFRHSGRLGMGLLPAYRGRGLGRRLMEAAIAAGWAAGLERIELEVFASNARAFALYEKLGFATEGVKRRARKLDDETDDNVLMALLRE
jgi:ribosomal protein S18 acetylase RimI-like enzyme